MKARPKFERCVRVLQHPRTQASVEVVYGFHGIVDAHNWATMLVYAGILVVAIVHVIWAAHSG